MGYQKITSHQMGPSTMDCTEFGDSWDTAMKKADGMFKELFEKIEKVTMVGGTATAPATLGTDIKALVHEVASAVHTDMADMHGRVAALEKALGIAAKVTPDKAAPATHEVVAVTAAAPTPPLVAPPPPPAPEGQSAPTAAAPSAPAAAPAPVAPTPPAAAAAPAADQPGPAQVAAAPAQPASVEDQLAAVLNATQG